MKSAMITFDNDKEKSYITWLEKMGLVETMYIMVVLNHCNVKKITRKSILYRPNKESVWWKRRD